MSSALAQQLRAIASLDADRLASHHGAPVGKSYLFPPKVASSHDNNAIYNIAISGLEELVEVEPEMLEFEEELFSDASRTTDRMMLTAEENKRLNVVLDRCILKLGKWITLKATSKCLEWLVRRFRVHELNVHASIQAFLPYHDSPYFPRILSILTLSKEEPLHNALHSLQAGPQPLDRSLLVRAMSPSKDPSLAALREVLALLPLAKNGDNIHRTLLTFWSATLVDYVERIRSSKKEKTEEVVKVLTEGIFKSLEAANGDEQMMSAILPPLLLFLRSFPLAEPPFTALYAAVPLQSSTPERSATILLTLLEFAPPSFEGDDVTQQLSTLDVRTLGPALVSVGQRCQLDRGLGLLVDSMLIEPAVYKDAIESIIGQLDMPSPLVDRIAGGLKHAEDDKAARRILAVMRERYPAQVESATASSKRERAARKPKPADRLVDVSMEVDEDDDDDIPALVQVYSADASTRAHGIARIMRQTGELSEDDRSSTTAALLARAADEDVDVLSALYDSATDLFARVTPLALLQAISPVMYDPTTPKDLIVGHLKFIRSWASLGLDSPSLLDDVFQYAYFPLLMWTKTRRETTRAAWKAISAGHMSRFDVMNGVSGMPEYSNNPDASVDLTAFGKLNGKLTAKLADNILSSSDSAGHIAFLLKQAKAVHPQARIFAQLILAQILLKSSPDAQLALSRDVLTCATEALANDFASVLERQDQLSQGLIVNIQDPALLEKVYTKSSHGRTAVWVAEALIGTLSTVRKPDGGVSWLCPGDDDIVKAQYRAFATGLYSVVNLAGLSKGMSTNLLRALFWNLGEDALLFLTSIWTEASIEAGIRCAALRHGEAFILACSNEGTRQDFQCVLPTVLVTLSDDSEEVRQCALSVVEAISKTLSGKASKVYGLAEVYGKSSNQVQLLRASDVQAYVGRLLDSGQDIIASAGQAAIVHGRILAASSSEDKKSASLRQSIVAYLYSHVCAWKSFRPRCELLRLLGKAIDKARMEAMEPLIRDLSLEASAESAWITSLNQQEATTFSQLLCGPMEKSAVKQLARGQTQVFTTYLAILQRDPVRFGASWCAFRLAIATQLGKFAFPQLSIFQQCDFLEVLLTSMNPREADDFKSMKDLVQGLHLDPQGKVEMIDRLRRSSRLGETSNQAKRARASSEDEYDRLLPLVLFLESRLAGDDGGDEGVLGAYIDLLSDLLSDTQAAASSQVNHVQQTLLRLMLQTATQIKQSSTKLKEPLGVEVIVKLIRNSSNPRTAQDALLLLGTLASLAPDSVLHNIMPVFTYMGTDEIQRDDAHSIAVVEKTIESIVPVLLGSYQQQGAEGSQLVLEARGLLKIFADMSLRLPSHRAVPFFTHLVKVMGPRTFLGPLEILLVEQRVTKPKAAASKGTSSSLPLVMEKQFSTGERLQALSDLLSEARQLRHQSTAQTPAIITVDSSLSDEEQQTKRSALLLALLQFFLKVVESLQLSTNDAQPLKQIAEVLLEEVCLPDVTSAKNKKSVRAALTECLKGTLDILPAVEMVDIAVNVAGRGKRFWRPTLSILQDRLPLMRPDVRQKVSPQLIAILTLILRELPTAGNEDVTVISDLVIAIAGGNIPTEDSAITQFVQVWLSLLTKVNDEKVAIALYSYIGQMPKRLGPRMIPFVKSLFMLCIKQLSSHAVLVTAQALQATSAVISALPGFLPQGELVQLVLGSLAAKDPEVDPAVGSFLASIGKHLPASESFPVILQTWPQVDKQAAQSLQRFFKLLQRAVRSLDRNALPTAIKPLFSLYLDAFGLGQMGGATAAHDDARDAAIDSFMELVTKLNESSFKPLMGRLHDWALIEAEDEATGKVPLQRRATLFRILDRLLKKFKAIMLPYLGMVEDELFQLLSRYRSGDLEDVPLWSAMISLLGRSFEVDDGSFWTREKSEKFLPAMTCQLSILGNLKGETEVCLNTLTLALATAADAMASSETVLKALNTAILLETRSEDAGTRVAAISALGAVWQKKGEEMIPLVPETVAQFLSELIEDENADVEKAARGVLTVIEGLVGDLQAYLT